MSTITLQLCSTYTHIIPHHLKHSRPVSTTEGSTVHTWHSSWVDCALIRCIRNTHKFNVPLHEKQFQISNTCICILVVVTYLNLTPFTTGHGSLHSTRARDEALHSLRDFRDPVTITVPGQYNHKLYMCYQTAAGILHPPGLTAGYPWYRITR